MMIWNGCYGLDGIEEAAAVAGGAVHQLVSSPRMDRLFLWQTPMLLCALNFPCTGAVCRRRRHMRLHPSR